MIPKNYFFLNCEMSLGNRRKNSNSCFWENLENNWDWLGKGDSKQNVCLVWLGGCEYLLIRLDV